MRARTRAGYTLVELMMIVMIIGVSVMVFTPGFSRAMADRRVSLAARELIRIGRRARSDTFGYLRAHLLFINAKQDVRTIQLLRGPTNSCTLPTNWSEIVTDCGATATSTSGFRCVENVFLSSMSSATRTISIFEETSTGTYTSSGRALCFQPSGVMMFGSGADVATAAANLSSTNATGSINGGFVFALLDGTAQPSASNVTQRVHRVLFPVGGSVRSLR